MSGDTTVTKLPGGLTLVTRMVREETFTFSPNDGMPDIHIRSGQLREWLLAKAMDKVGELVFPEQTLDELVRNHGLEEPRMASMNMLEAAEPVIVGILSNGNSILIDGGHRRWFWAKQGIHTLPGWAVPEEVWRAFEFDPNDFAVISHKADGSMLPHRRNR